MVVSRQTVLSPEKGRSDPGLPLTFRIAALFRCRIEDVVTPGVDGGQRA
ncbi:helix-turn-helix transcriptional regulator [Pseudonocardia artemisiae]